MSTKLDLPFNFFTWSILLFLFFCLIQIVVVTAVTFSGFSFFAPVALFNWFAVTTAISYSLVSRYKARKPHLLLVQGVACFYMTLGLGATVLRGGEAFGAALVAKLIMVAVALFAAGIVGVIAGETLRSRIRS